jgi:hypothetical protein
MTLDDLEKMEERLLARLLPWAFKARKLIDSHVEDAKAHASNALTATVRDTPDGRATVRKLGKSRSATAAAGHLDTLEDDLAELVRDARAAFYADSIRLWLPFVEEGYRIPKASEPNKQVERIMRDAVISGYTLEMRLSPAIATAKRTLAAQLNMGGASASNDRLTATRLTTWATQTSASIGKTIESILSDSDTAIHEATGWLLIDPKHRGERLVDKGAGLAFPKDAT